IDVLGKIAVEKFLGGYRKRLWTRCSFPVSLVIEHEKALVAPVVDLRDEDRTLHLPAELVQIVGVLRQPLRIVLEGIRVPLLAASEFIHGAVKVIRAALQRYIDDAAAGVAILRVIRV